DSKSGKQIMYLLQKLHKEGNTIVMVTHETFTSEHAERIIRIADGKIISDDKVLNRRRADLEEDLLK
ncbi:macrolide ABC transporter ATP-binding protein, partial [Candidatus Nomurabacteria bacterium]|nr:macrolide ABC transporter ATP-binding protein [Candidatus Nomurabacteria bacterium]